MARMECRECGYVSPRARNCAGSCGEIETMHEVDEEKDALRAENERLREALTQIGFLCRGTDEERWTIDEIGEVARAALGKEG